MPTKKQYFYAFLVFLLSCFLAVYVLIFTEQIKKIVEEGREVPVESELPLEITFLDIGQGDATFIAFTTGQQMLVDCAVDGRIIEALGRVMNPFDRYIDYVVVTHPDADHYGGCIDVFRRFEVGTIIYNGYDKGSSSFWREFMKSVDEEVSDEDFHVLVSPEIWNIGEVELFFMYPDSGLRENFDSNNNSIVIKVSYGEQDVLLIGDAEAQQELYLAQIYGDKLSAEILKAGHHGSDSSSVQEFIEYVQPKDVVISSGVENSYGHPSQRVLNRFERLGSAVWRTDQRGDILLTVFPQNYAIE